MKKKLLLGILAMTLCLNGCSSNIKDGVSLLKDGKYEEAISAFQLEIDEEKNLDEANRGIGIAYYELENYTEAVAYFGEALAQGAEESASIYQLMAASCMQLGDYENAIVNYDKALTMEDLTDAMKQEALFNSIAAYENLADWESAKEAVQTYLEVYPDDERALKEADFLKTR